MPSIIINDENFNDHIETVIEGERKMRGLIPRDFKKVPFGAMPSAPGFEIPIIPRNEWQARIKEMEETKSRLSDVRRSAGLKSSDQGNVPFCWCHGPMNGMRVVRAVNNQPYADLSATSVGAQITGFRKQGGWGGDFIEFVAKNGITTTKLWPENSFERRLLTDEMKVDALTRKLTEWMDIEPNNLNQLITCLLLRLPVAVGLSWWGHEVVYLDPIWLDGEVAVRGWNSWGDGYGEEGEFILQGRKIGPDDAQAVRVISATAA